jgi:hypothetical protein
MLHMLLWLYTYISSVSFKCFTYFRLMLQVFYLNDVKVDLIVAYVAMNIHVCFKRMLQVFHLFQTYVASVSSRCFKSRSGRAHVSSAATALQLLGHRAWVTVQAPEAGKHLHGSHPQAGQVARTHVGLGMSAGRGMGCWSMG